MRGTTKFTESVYNLVAMLFLDSQGDNSLRIQEKFNVTDGRDRNFGVDFLFFFFDFFLKSLDLPNIFNYRC